MRKKAATDKHPINAHKPYRPSIHPSGLPSLHLFMSAVWTFKTNMILDRCWQRIIIKIKVVSDDKQVKECWWHTDDNKRHYLADISGQILVKNFPDINTICLRVIFICLLPSSSLFRIRLFTFTLLYAPPLLTSSYAPSAYFSTLLSSPVALSLTTVAETQLKPGEREIRLTVETFTHNARGAQFVLKMLKPKKNSDWHL